MNRIYQEISQRLIEAFYLYIEDKLTIDELEEIDKEEKLLREYKNWDSMKAKLRESIFSYTKMLYDQTNQLEKDIRHLEQLNQEMVIDVDIEGILAHAQILGRNRMPPPECVGSNWYVKPFPTLQMVPSLQEEDEELNCDSSLEN